MAKSDENKNPKTETTETENAGNSPELDTQNTDDTSDTNNTNPLASIADTLAQSMPEVQEHAIDQEKVKQDKAQEQYKGITDRDGRPFDPAIHKTNKHGEPTVTAKGNCILKPKPRNGSTPNAESTPRGSVIGGRVSPEQAQATQVKAQARATGAMAANLLLTVGMAAGGEEWQPIKDAETGLDEKAMLEQSFADYFEATGKTDLPPAMALTVAIGAYALPRFTMPKTQTRLGKVKAWFVKKLADRKLKKHNLKAESRDKPKAEKEDAVLEA